MGVTGETGSRRKSDKEGNKDEINDGMKKGQVGTGREGCIQVERREKPCLKTGWKNDGV